METRIYKSGLLLLISLFFSSAVLISEEATREFNKEYTAGPNTTLDLSNKYGKVIVETTDQDRITIDVKVTVELPSKERAERLLSYIDVKFSEEGDLIKAQTVIDNKFNFTGWGGSSRRFSIDYKVNMPSRINFNLSNRYGNSELGPIDGLVRIDIKYGNLTAYNLSRGNEKPINYISLAYGKAEIESAGWIDVVLRYCGNFTVENGQAMLLDSKYSKIEIEEISSIVGESKYDNIQIEKINNLVLDAGYSDIDVGELSKTLKFEGGYGNLAVENIPEGFETIETDSKYIGVKLGIDSDASYELDARLSYGDLKFDESNFQHQRRIVENNSSETAGIVGKESTPVSKVRINSSYGSVRLY